MTDFTALVSAVGEITTAHIEERLSYWNGVIDAWSGNTNPRLQWWADKCLDTATHMIAHYSHKAD